MNETTTQHAATPFTDGVDLKSEKVTLSLPCPLTDAERLEIGVQLGEVHQSFDDARSRIDAENERHKSAKKMLEADAERHRDAASDLAKDLRQGLVHRNVECVEESNYRTGMMRWVRLDTGEVVEERAMTAEERQPDLPGVSTDDDGASDEEAAITDPQGLMDLKDEGTEKPKKRNGKA